MNPLRPRNWIISRQQRWQYLWSISISPGIPNSRRRKKNVTVGETNSGPATNDRQRSGTPDPRPQSVYQRHVMVHGPQKKKASIQSIFFSASWGCLGSIGVTHSQSVTGYLLQILYKVELPSWSLNYLQESCCFQARWKWDVVAGVSGNRPWTMRSRPKPSLLD